MALELKGDDLMATVCVKRVVASLLRVAEMPAEQVPAAVRDSLRAYAEVASLPSPSDPAERALFGCEGVRTAGKAANVLMTCASPHAMVSTHTHVEQRAGARAEPCMAYRKQEQLAGVWVATAPDAAEELRWVLALAIPRKMRLIPYDTDISEPARRLARLLLTLASLEDEWVSLIGGGDGGGGGGDGGGDGGVKKE